MLTNFCRMKGLASWQVTAMDAEVWNSLLPEFLAFSLPNVMWWYVMCIYGSRITFVLFAPVPETGCPTWHAGLTLTLYTTAFYMRQKLTHEAKCQFHTTSPISLHDPRFAFLQYAWSLDSEVCRGRPTRRVPKGCHDSKRWTHRCAGKVATCLAKLQQFLHVMYDQTPVVFAIKLLTRSFHTWSTSFPAAFQSTSGGGPTIDLHNFDIEHPE